MGSHIAFALLIGGIVGFIGHVRKKGKIIRPRKTKKFIYLGFLEDVLMGAFTAFLLVISSGADSFFRIAFVSILAGIGSEALLKGVEVFRVEQKPTSTTEVTKNE